MTSPPIAAVINANPTNQAAPPAPAAMFDPNPRMPIGFATGGRPGEMTIGVGSIHVNAMMSDVTTTADQASGRQRRDGSRPLGNSRNANNDNPAGNTGTTTQLLTQAAQRASGKPPDTTLRS